MQHSTGYIIGFATAVCFVCALVVAGSAVGLKDRQDRNIRLDRQKKVLVVAGLMRDGEKISAEEATSRFEANIQARIVDLEAGEYAADIDPATFDQSRATKDPEQSNVAPDNKARVRRLPKNASIFQVVQEGEVQTIILPIEGKGLWGTLYGYLALAPDTTSVKGITFYKHQETPGLGGEVDNPRWKALWPGRKAFNAEWNPALTVKKGRAGSPDTDPHQVDGLSGATITSRSVGHLVQFWLGEHGFGPYLENVRAQQGS
jgi:Na+-transporting NADH:ubiquinone oxidoreductase subunit C